MHLLLVEMKSSSDRGNVGGGAAAAAATSKQVVNLVEERERERGMLPFCVSMCLMRGWREGKRGQSGQGDGGRSSRLASPRISLPPPTPNPAHTQMLKRLKLISYVYRTEHHLHSWIKRDQLDVTCFIISLFTAQHVSDVNTSILRRLILICWVISWVVLLWFDVCWCYVVVWLGWCGIRMQDEGLVLQPAYGYHTRTIQPMK